MLDAFIIDRIRQQRQREKATQIPMRIEVPDLEPPVRPEYREEKREDQERGIAIIDFGI